MNILMIGPDVEKVPGGMATVVKNYFKYGLDKLVKIHFLSTTIEGSLLTRSVYNFIAILKFVIIINKVKYNIIHIHMAERGSFFRKSIYILISKIFKIKVIVHLHGAEFEEFYINSNKAIKKYISYILDECNTIIVLSREWKFKIKKMTNTEIEVLFNSISIPNNYLYNNKSLNISMVGRMAKRKGIYDLLDIMEDIIKVDDKVKFVLAGDGELDKINNIIKDKKLSKHVHLLGWVDEEKRAEIYRDTCIYVLPSYNEGMPMSILEAISYGIPVVSTVVGGIPSIITNDVNGYLINPGDKNKLKESLIYLIKNEKIRNSISKENYALAINKFNIYTHINELYLIYKKVMKE